MNPFLIAVMSLVALGYFILLMVSWASDSKQPWNRDRR